MSYEAQLEYLTPLRSRLRRLYGSDELAAKMIAGQFKPLLKIPGSKAAAKALPKPRRDPVLVPRDEAVETAIKDLVAWRPGVMSQKTWGQVLTGRDSPKLRASGLHQAEQYGRLSQMTRASVGAHIVATIERGCITRGADGMLGPTRVKLD